MEHIYYADTVPNAEEAAVDPADGLVLLSDDESDDEGAHGPSRGLSEETEVPTHRIRPRVRNILGLFGKENMEAYTEWLKLVKILVLLQPSSAAAERVFALLASMFSKKQRKSSTRRPSSAPLPAGCTSGDLHDKFPCDIDLCGYNAHTKCLFLIEKHRS